MSVANEIKSIVVGRGRKLTDIAEITGQSLQNLSKKIRNETISYKEAKEIASVLGMKIIWVEDEKTTANK